MEDIDTVEDAREAAKNRGMEDWEGVPEDEADFESFTDTAEYANKTLPFLRGLAQELGQEGYVTHEYDDVIEAYWDGAHEQVHD